jgi:sulfatase maturation enzyme AslB (radical SAM superfamily)
MKLTKMLDEVQTQVKSAVLRKHFDMPFLKNAAISLWPSLHRIAYRRPYYISIEITNACNLKCEMCYRSKRKAGIGYMDFDLFCRIVDEAAQIGNVYLSLFLGGESTLHPQFDDMIEYAMSHRNHLYGLGFFTNGMLLDKHKSELLVRLAIDDITFSLDGIGSVTENIRLGSVYSVVERNILNLLKIRGTHPKPKISINTTITVQSDDELQAIYNQWQGKVDAIIFSGCGDESFRITNWSRVRKWNPNYTLPKFCTFPFYWLYVLWNGDVTICCHDVAGEGNVGNVCNCSLIDVWRGDKLEAVRQGILSGDMIGLCSKCMKFKTGNEIDR